MGRRFAIAALVLALSALATGGVVAATRPSDDDALKPTRQPASRSVENRVSALLAKMTTTEKLEQLQLLSDGQITDDAAKAGVGGVFSLVDPAKINHFQHVAVEQSRLHIPILFAYDTIHGYRTTFPIPLGEASSFDPGVATADDTIAARETAAVGIKQIYSPMVDISHEPRWGRISEGAGEDPYLGSVMAAARVQAAQGSDYSAPDKVVTSPKHFAAYGQPEGGREYNTTDMSPQRLWNMYLPPFKAAVDAGADTVMCSFNAINGVPGCANSQTETDILKRQWGFDGFIESDYTAVAELRTCPPKNPDSGPCGHGVAADGADAAQAALNAGTDSEMVSTNFVRLRQAAARTAPDLDGADRRCGAPHPAGQVPRRPVRAPLRRPGADPEQDVTPDDRRAARDAAGKSMVLLKNDKTGGNPTLPFDTGKSTAVIGPLGNDQHDMLGPWWGQGQDADAVSLYTGIKAQDPNTTFTPGCTMSNQDLADPDHECADTSGFDAAVAAANAADQVVLALGETREMSGEAESRSNIDLPGQQQALLDRIAATGKPLVVVLFNGRPLTLSKVVASAPAILEAWFPGVEAGNAAADVLFGKVNPGGKLPVTVPAERRPGADLLQPRADRPPVRHDAEVQLALPRHTDVRAAVPVRLRPELHDVRGLEPEAQLVDDAPQRQRHGIRRRQEHRHPCGRRRRPALYPRPRGEHLATGAPPARLPARDARAGPDEDGLVPPRRERRRLLRQLAASSSWSPGQSTSTRATARWRT